MDRAARPLKEASGNSTPCFHAGRTLNDAFVILDEAQNSASEQMKMFITRLAIEVLSPRYHPDRLPDKRSSGLVEIQHI
jgi:phosphate starvation-inducible PhoH-like protein